MDWTSRSWKMACLFVIFLLFEIKNICYYSIFSKRERLDDFYFGSDFGTVLDFE